MLVFRVFSLVEGLVARVFLGRRDRCLEFLVTRLFAGLIERRLERCLSSDLLGWLPDRLLELFTADVLHYDRLVDVCRRPLHALELSLLSFNDRLHISKRSLVGHRQGPSNRRLPGTVTVILSYQA